MKSSFSDPHYKHFVDGLRAISIVSVVGFHVDGALIPGGFVGVDIFFVISGYLIIGQLRAAIETGRHSLREFWARRVLRILPPYLLVIIASLALSSWVLATAEDLHELGSEVLWSAAMAANHYFLLQQGYFDTSADTKPLLHLWSLAVEEQFYLVAPLILSGIWFARTRVSGRVAGKLLGWGLALGLFAASLFLCVHLTDHGDGGNAAFYLMPLRAWEFMAGGAVTVAVGLLQSRSPRSANFLAVAGLALVVFALAGFSEDTPFPSYRAIIPVLGACAIIAAGLLNESLLLVRWLSFRPLTFVGLVSYSWYLWHWPLIVFTRIWNFGERSLLNDALAAGLAFLLATATFLLVERPVRLWRQRTRPKLTWWTTAWGLSACGIIGAVGGMARPEVVPTNAVEDENRSEEKHYQFGECDFTSKPKISACKESLGARQLALVAGDSHASGVYRFVTETFEYSDTVLSRSTSRNCSPLFDVGPAVIRDRKWDKRCDQRKLAIKEGLSSGEYRPRYVLFSARWLAYGTGGAKAVVPAAIQGRGRDLVDSDEVLKAELRATLKYFLDHGTERILIIGPTPELPHLVPRCVAQAQLREKEINGMCGANPASSDLQRIHEIAKLLEDAVDGLEGVRMIDSLASLCSSTMCPAEHAGELLYLDQSHLSHAGFSLLYERNRELFHWVSGVK